MFTEKQLLKAKIPGPETGIEIRRSYCDLCASQSPCGVDCYVKDGVIIKMEGAADDPAGRGRLCTKGAGNRQFLYRADRVKTPLRRVGERGEGRFEPISWDEALSEVSEKLLKIKKESGPEAVAFFAGYTKWFRPIYQRFTHSFGCQNYGTESSCCFTSGLMAWKIATGAPSGGSMNGAGCYLAWPYNNYYSKYNTTEGARKFRERGGKIIVIDVRRTQAVEKLADLFIQPRLGTDGALALALANILIQRGAIDRDYIEKYVYGFEEYAEYCRGFNESNLERLTGVPWALAEKAAEMIAENLPVFVNQSASPMLHHVNGMQNYRAMMALSAITGSFDRKGGNCPAEFTFGHQSAGFSTMAHEFIEEKRPDSRPPIGTERFPLWGYLEREMQSMDLPRQILEGTPYPVRAIFALGMNMRMFPNVQSVIKALKKVDFFVDTDLFLTDTAKYADIVLPCCSSFERYDFKTYGGGLAWCPKPAIEPLGEARSDVDILTDLANRMDFDDDILRGGWDVCMRYITRNLSISWDEIKAAERPIKIPDFRPYVEREYSEKGMNTPTGKFELKSKLIEDHPEWGLDALPTYRPPLNDVDPGLYPFTLCTGARIPNAIHSRLHDVPWERSLRPHPLADISPEDAEELGVKRGDMIEVFTKDGCVTLGARPTSRVKKGEVFIYHGDREADASLLLDKDHLDPYSGFPGFRSTRCGMRKAAK